jgi:hypothetical protein
MVQHPARCGILRRVIVTPDRRSERSQASSSASQFDGTDHQQPPTHALGSCPDDIEVEVKPGIPMAATTVADLRSLSSCPPGLVLEGRIDPDPRYSAVRVERAS